MPWDRVSERTRSKGHVTLVTVERSRWKRDTEACRLKVGSDKLDIKPKAYMTGGETAVETSLSLTSFSPVSMVDA